MAVRLPSIDNMGRQTCLASHSISRGLRYLNPTSFGALFILFLFVLILLFTLHFRHLPLPLSFIPSPMTLSRAPLSSLCFILIVIGWVSSRSPLCRSAEPFSSDTNGLWRACPSRVLIDFRPFPLRFYEVAHIPLSSLVSSVTNHALTIHLPFGHSTSLSPRASLSTALPHPSAALTIFYILYHLPLSSLHILPFSTL